MSRVIGIVGGLSPESTAEYYHLIMKMYREHSGEENYPEVIIYSLSYGRMAHLRIDGKKAEYVARVAEALRALKCGGADFAIIASNTPHMYFKEIEKASPIPLISISQATLEQARAMGMKKLLLLATMYTISAGFYQREGGEMGLEVVVPDEAEEVNSIIYNELVKGIFGDGARHRIRAIIQGNSKGVDGVILGCTELPLLIRPGDVDIPVLSTTEIHVRAALRMWMED